MSQSWEKAESIGINPLFGPADCDASTADAGFHCWRKVKTIVSLLMEFTHVSNHPLTHAGRSLV